MGIYDDIMVPSLRINEIDPSRFNENSGLKVCCQGVFAGILIATDI